MVGLLLTLQFPPPSHHSAGLKTFAPAPVVGHDCAWHTVIIGYFSHPPAPLQLPSLPQGNNADVTHWLVVSCLPAPMGVHVPAVPASVHETQVPSQAVLQQTPSFEQTPVWHWLVAVHEPPGPLRPQEPEPIEIVQVALGAQTLGAVQFPLQAAAEPHVLGKHDPAAGVAQWPAPSQVDWAVITMPPGGQVWSRHFVPAMYFWQAPAMHLPLVPQLVAPWSAHSPLGSPVPVVTFVHVPSVPLSEHDLQEASQVVTQQTPWAQMPEPQSPAAPQGAPGSLLPHERLLQTLGATQFVADVAAVHESKHLVPLQAKGVHTLDPGATHWPVLLQVGAPV
jgi:hypothetical protein